MNTKKHLMYAGMCLTVLTCALGVKAACAGSATEVVTVNVSAPQPDVILTPPTWTSGNYFAVNAKTGTATIVVDPTGVVTPNTNTFPSARLTGSDTVGTALHVQVGSVTAGAPNAAMSLKIDDATAHTAAVNVTDGVAGDAPFVVNTWTAGTPVSGTLTGFSGTTGLGTLTLDNTGQADVSFGATVSTVADSLPKPYNSGAYTGTVEVVLSY